MMKISLELSNFLNVSRWISALIVVISHLRNLVFTDYDNVQNKTLLIKSFYFITGFGNQAVVIFFVLSGFLIGGSVLSKINSGNFSLYAYSIDRLSRIYVVFPLSLLVGLMFDWLGYLYFNETGVYTNNLHLATANFNISERLGVQTVISNIFMLQNVSTYPLGSNGPLWSLSNEWWYYFYFPLIILSFKYKILYKRIIAFIGVLFITILMNKSNEHGNMLFSFGIWIVGSGLWFIEGTKIKYLNFYASIVLLFSYLTLSRIANLSYLGVFLNSVILAILFSLTLKSIIQSNQVNEINANVINLNNEMASFSFSLYVTHLPLSVFLMAILSHLGIGRYQMQPNLSTYLIFFTILLVTYIFAYAFSLFTEKNRLNRLEYANVT